MIGLLGKCTDKALFRKLQVGRKRMRGKGRKAIIWHGKDWENSITRQNPDNLLSYTSLAAKRSTQSILLSSYYKFAQYGKDAMFKRKPS